IHGLKMCDLDVPGAVIAGKSVWLRCGYDLEEDELYSVKWYKNNVEFYRYLPSDVPPGQKYDLLGVYVDLSQSNETHVYLYKTDLNTEGSYGCEVSTEAPSFRTVKADRDLRVYESNDLYHIISISNTLLFAVSHTAPGQHGPNIKGNLPWYDVGDIVDVNCSTVYPAELTWYVNDYEAQPDYVIKYPVRKKPNEPDMSVLGLKMRIEHYHFRSDELRLKCTATQYKMITSSSEKILRSGNQQNSGFHAIENTGSGSYYRHIRWWALQTLVMTMIKLSSSVYH
ncbi:uncharacterized protein LOC111636097, partial [Centruroides sculpturatus]|uniref:uncharacterized protein LOC111636097 n=1 Tax=Centruroides sculpturatus TaxID=218467 RepID=UPI000C6D3229